MSFDPPDDTLEFQVQHLLPQVDTLLNAYAALQAENAALKADISNLKLEHVALMEKTTQARNRVDNMINRLKILEQSDER